MDVLRNASVSTYLPIKLAVVVIDTTSHLNAKTFFGRHYLGNVHVKFRGKRRYSYVGNQTCICNLRLAEYRQLDQQVVH